jgi:hypothetical protein
LVARDLYDAQWVAEWVETENIVYAHSGVVLRGSIPEIVSRSPIPAEGITRLVAHAHVETDVPVNTATHTAFIVKGEAQTAWHMTYGRQTLSSGL